MTVSAAGPAASQTQPATQPATAAAQGEAGTAAPPTRTVPLINSRFVPTSRTAKPVSLVLPLWLTTFRKDMRSVLLAELDIRLQPIEGLLAALRAS